MKKMAKKRKSSVGPEAPTPFNTNDRTRHLETDFEKLCKDALLDIPYDEQRFPAKYDNLLWRTYKFLWWRNKARLDDVINELMTDLTSMPCPQRVKSLLSKIEPLVAQEKELSRTPRTQKFKDIDDNDENDDCQNAPGQASPASPSQRARGLMRNFRATKPTNASPKLPVLDAPSIPTPERASMKKPLVQTTIAQSMGRQVRAAPAATQKIAPNISFKSTTEGNPSFNKTSFWSDVQGTQRTVDTAATSFSKDDQPTESTDYGSVVSSEKFIGLLRQLEPSQQSDSTMKDSQPLPRRSKSDMTSRESEFYCSSIDTHTADEYQVREDIFHAESCERRDTIMTVFEDENEDEVRQLSQLAEDAQTRITVVNPDIYNHEGPCKRQRLDVLPIEEPSEAGLVQMALPRQFRSLSFQLQWEVKRVLQTVAISPEVLNAEWGNRTCESLYKLVSERQINLQYPPKPGTKGGTLKSWEMFTRSAKLEWSKSKAGPLFNLVPQVVRKDTSCSLQRKLGADRVLYIDIPEVTKPPACFKNRDVVSQFREWIKQPQDFLGRTWSLFFLKPNKKTNTSESRTSSTAATVVLVAPPEGMSIGDVVQWWFPFDTNKQ